MRLFRIWHDGKFVTNEYSAVYQHGTVHGGDKPFLIGAKVDRNTTLLDRTGSEIFEGDFILDEIKDNHPCVHEVVWNPAEAAWFAVSLQASAENDYGWPLKHYANNSLVVDNAHARDARQGG